MEKIGLAIATCAFQTDRHNIYGCSIEMSQLPVIIAILFYRLLVLQLH